MKPGSSLVLLLVSVLLIGAPDLHAAPRHDSGYPPGVWQGSRPVRFSTIDAGQYGPWTKPAILLVGSPDEWETAMTTAGAMFPVEMPAIDWSRHVIVLAVLGQQPFPGYHIEIREALRHAHDLVLRVHIELPDGTNPTQNFSTPFHLLLVERWRSMGVRILYDAVVPELDREILRPRRDAGLGTNPVDDPGGGVKPTTWGVLKGRIR